MDRYDIAVIGTGPAGLEAAITAKVRNKSVLLLGRATLSQKVEKAHKVNNYLGLPDITGEKMQSTFFEHLNNMELSITEENVKVVYAMGKYFSIQGQNGTYEASAVILACGVSATKQIAGEVDNLGMGVSYCATCDAMLYRDKVIAVIGYSKQEEKEALFLSEVVAKVYYVALYDDASLDADRIEVIRKEKPVSIERAIDSLTLNLTSSSLDIDGIFILRDSVAPAQLVPGLSIEKNAVRVDRMMTTNISGLFACGDITGTPYQYIKAAGEGNVAALSAVSYLANIK